MLIVKVTLLVSCTLVSQLFLALLLIVRRQLSLAPLVSQVQPWLLALPARQGTIRTLRLHSELLESLLVTCTLLRLVSQSLFLDAKYLVFYGKAVGTYEVRAET